MGENAKRALRWAKLAGGGADSESLAQRIHHQRAADIGERRGRCHSDDSAHCKLDVARLFTVAATHSTAQHTQTHAHTDTHTHTHRTHGHIGKGAMPDAVRSAVITQTENSRHWPSINMFYLAFFCYSEQEIKNRTTLDYLPVLPMAEGLPLKNTPKRL